MSDVREELIGVIRGRKNLPSDVLADAVLERFDVTPKPEPPVISDTEFGILLAAALGLSNDGPCLRGFSVRKALASRGLEIVRKAETE